MRKILFLAGPLFLSLSSFAQHVTLSCLGPCGGTGAGPNCGYSFYRSADHGATYSLLNATPTAACRFVDTSVLYNGASYDYYAVTIDPSFSAPNSASSNITAATMPMQPPANAIATLDNPPPPGGILATGWVSFSWANNPGVNVQTYDLIDEELQGQKWVLLTDYQWSGSLIPAGTRSAYLSIPQNGDMLHVNLRTNFEDGTSASQDVFFRETAPSGVPQILTPLQFSNDCTPNDPNGNVTFTWSSGPADTTTYYLHAGTGPGGWDVGNWNVGLVNRTTVPILGQGPRIVWVSVQASSPSKGTVSSDVYADAYVACHAIS